MPVHHTPKGFHAVTPFLVVEGASKLIDFLVSSFGAVEHSRSAGPDGVIFHAEVQVGDSMLMLCDANPQWPAQPGNLYVYGADCDAAYERAIAAGATSISAPADQFYGDRNGTVMAFGIRWSIGTHIEDVSDEEMQKRMAAYLQKAPATV